MQYLRQSTASQEVILGPFLDDTDGKTAETALSIANTDIKVWKTGGTTESSKNSGGATHIASGRYYTVLDATDTDTIGPLELNIHVSGALPVKLRCCVLDEAVYDVLFGTTAPSTYAGADTSGTTTLLSRIGSALTITSGRVNADITHIATAAVNTSTAQLGVNVVNFGGSAGTFTSGRPEVNTTHAAGTAWGSGAVTAASIAASALNGKGDWNVGKTGYTLSQAFPTNFSSLAITVGGAVTAGTVSDKTGYSLTQSFPSNFASLGINASGHLSRVTLVDTTTTNTDMRGTDNAATAANLAIVAGYLDTEVAAILEDTGTTIPAQIAALSIPSASTVASAVRTELGTELGRIDVAISTRGTGTALDAAGVRAAVGLASANLDTQLADLPTVSEFEARTIVSANYATAANLATVAGYLDLEIAAILEDTGTTIPAQISALNNLSSAQAQTAAAAALAAYDPPTNAEMEARTVLAASYATASSISALNNLSAAQVNAEVDQALADYDSPTNAEMVARTLAAASYGTAANQTTIISHLTDVKGATFSEATDSLEAIRDRGDSSWTTATGFAVVGDIPTADQNAAALMDLANGVETGLTPRQALRLLTAALAGELSGAATTTITIRNTADTKNRITATVDTDGNRTAITYDLS